MALSPSGPQPTTATPAAGSTGARLGDVAAARPATLTQLQTIPSSTVSARVNKGTIHSSGATINSYVIVDIENQPGLFAYIDNAATRTPAAALQTAGFNGVASVIVKVIKFAEEVRQGVYDTSGLDQLQRLSPAEILSLAKNYPNAQRASRSAASDWSDASEYLSGRKDIVAYVGMRIIDQHGEDVADDFFHEITNTGDGTPEQILALRTVVDKDLRSDKPMKRHHTAAMLIKVFNAWHRQESLGRRWMMMVNEDFPVLDDEPQANAAE